MEFILDSQIPEELAALSINDLNLTPKAHAALRNARITTVGAILETERGKGLLRVRNLGKAQYEDILSVLRELCMPEAEGLVYSEESELDMAAPELPCKNVQPPPTPTPVSTAADKPLPKTVVFVDYESWYIALWEIHRRRPNIQAWFDDLRKRGQLLEVTFFGDFSDTGGMRDEINYIRRFTNRIIETKNISEHSKKSFTDFIMLDNIYQKVIASPEIEQIVLFTGDGDFCSVASYLRNFCGKVVGVYGVDDALSSQLEAISDWCVRLPFGNEPYQECRAAILSNLKYAEAHTKSATFRPTVRLVAEHYNLPEDAVEAELRLLIDEGIIYTVPERSRRDYTIMLNVLKVQWDKVDTITM
ncbi:NYN domain-containing protein [Ruminococcaceae bacterium OttesenSCG-928-L11]|nr:NYN domain-containing protein [Ruminococcaceae bacterium OttesenSCG-928-L11]